MFSLLITVISIALVAALALATLYYGGSAFNKGSAEAEAAKVLNQGQQLLGAADMFYADNGRWPANIGELTADGKYLKSAPSAASTMARAMAAGDAWGMPITGQPVFLSAKAIDELVCATVNLHGSLKKKGILKNAYTSLNAQCFGAPGAYKVVFKKFATPESLDDAVDGVDNFAGVRSNSAIPADNEADAWAKSPLSYASDGGTGVGVNPPPAPPSVTLTFAGVTFPQTTRDTTNAMVAAVRNDSVMPVSLAALVFAGDPVFAGGLGSCAAELAPAQTCELSLSYSPTSQGVHAGAVTLRGSSQYGGFTSQELTLSGTAVNPLADLSFAAVDFPATNVNTSASVQAPVRNNSPMSVTITDIQFTGDSAFGGSLGSCSGALAPGQSCNLTVTYAPAAAGSHTGSVTLTGASAYGSFVASGLALSGSATIPQPALGTTAVSFAQTTRTSSSTLTTTVRNDSLMPITLTGASFEGTQMFSYSLDGCTAPVAPGSSCSMTITYTPTAPGSASASVSFSGTSQFGTFVLPGPSISGTSVNPTWWCTSSPCYEYATSVVSGAPYFKDPQAAANYVVGRRGSSDCRYTNILQTSAVYPHPSSPGDYKQNFACGDPLYWFYGANLYRQLRTADGP